MNSQVLKERGVTPIAEMVEILKRHLVVPHECTDCAIVYQMTFDTIRAIYDEGRATPAPIPDAAEGVVLSAPTGEPARTWTEQEKTDLRNALDTVIDHEKLKKVAAQWPTVAGLSNAKPEHFQAAWLTKRVWDLTEDLEAKTAVVDDLAMLVRRLVHHLAKASPENDLPVKALDYLDRKGLKANLMRDDVSALRDGGGVEAPKSWREFIKECAGSSGVMVDGNRLSIRAAALLEEVPGDGGGVPEGWKLVPIEPTEKMLEAGYFTDAAANRAIYRDMLEAAPLPPSPAAKADA